jgi:F-type H+-transporting ATPase subunit gamma
METIESLRGKMESAEDLFSIARTMKVLAAVNVRHYQAALESLREYHRTIEMGLQIVLQSEAQTIPEMESVSGSTLGAVVIGANQGLAGQFSNRVVSYALRGMEKLGAPPNKRHVLVIGMRTAAHMNFAGHPVEKALASPNSLGGVTSSVIEVLLKVEEWRDQHDVQRIVLFFNTPASGTAFHTRMRWLLPVDLDWLRDLQTKAWDSRVLPISTMDRTRLFSALLHQYFFVLLYRAFVESLTSENTTRLATMQAAEQNIEDRLTELTTRYHHLRQSSITEELLDIASGFEALTNVEGE